MNILISIPTLINIYCVSALIQTLYMGIVSHLIPQPPYKVGTIIILCFRDEEAMAQRG